MTIDPMVQIHTQGFGLQESLLLHFAYMVQNNMLLARHVRWAPFKKKSL